MSKHTPGPWKAYRKADYTTPGWVILWPDKSKPGVHYRRLDSNGGFLEEDARLIASAPVLLDALQSLMRLVRSNAPELAGKAMGCADAAIAKATGETA